MLVKVHVRDQSKPVEIRHVRNCYEKGSFFCVMTEDGLVQKFPVMHLFRVVESWGGSDSENGDA